HRPRPGAADFTAVGLPDAATVTPGSVYGQASIDWLPTAADVGRYTVLITVADDGNGDPSKALHDQQSFTLVVRASNQAPTWLPTGTLTAPEGKAFSKQLQATDPDGDQVSYSAANLPVGAKLDSATGTLTWTPGLFQVGTYSGIVLTASDGNR